VSSAERRMLNLALIETASRCQCRDGFVARRLERDCWATLADLAEGCRCEEAAETLLTSAWKWLAGETAA
jgi:hypothetical protein